MNAYGYAHDPHDQSREDALHTPQHSPPPVADEVRQAGHDPNAELHPKTDERMYWFLTILCGMGGTSDASDGQSWTNTFCEDRGKGDDTFNLAETLGYTQVSHQTCFDISTVYLLEPGRAALHEADLLRSSRAQNPPTP